MSRMDNVDEVDIGGLKWTKQVHLCPPKSTSSTFVHRWFSAVSNFLTGIAVYGL